MLEGAVARLLNQVLGKYVVDLDTENLNVGIFSGFVQLTDLKLKCEALYELDLPIHVRAGTIGKISLQIPWTSLWNQPVVVNVEDVHVIAVPNVGCENFDGEKNKRLVRALKRKAIADLSKENDVIGGPKLFSEHLLANAVNNLHLVISNVHIRYEDCVSTKYPLAAGICIGSITAETTNSKWKACKTQSDSGTCYYLMKVEALSTYWNPKHEPIEWDFPAQYYQWRNSMSSSLQNFTMGNQEFDFLIKPMTTKVKLTINKSSNGNIMKLHSDVVVQDCNVQISNEQYKSILDVGDSLSRMFISWNFLSIRPSERISIDKRTWWKYAFEALLEQRVRPYTWSRIKNVRDNYKTYMELYKKILLNPNDTELKMDLQQYEDKLSVINIIIARQQARLTVQTSSLSEKSFWSMLPSPERSILCEKIGFVPNLEEQKLQIEHNYNLRVGNVSVALLQKSREILVLTLTQFNFQLKPNFQNSTYKMATKVEGLIIEGASLEEHLVPIVASEHLSNSPAYFFKLEVEKLPKNSKATHKLNCVMDSVEIIYHKYAFQELGKYLENDYFDNNSVLKCGKSTPYIFYKLLQQKLSKKWDLNFDVKIPFLVLPQAGINEKAENILVIDLGRYLVTTELCQVASISENATQMELEEQLFSRLHVECSNMQVLFCDNGDWKDAKREKDTDMHIIPKTNFHATYASCVKNIKTIPSYKFSINFETIKINLSERKSNQLLNFFNSFQENPLLITTFNDADSLVSWKEDRITGKFPSKYLERVQNGINVADKLLKIRKTKSGTRINSTGDRKFSGNIIKENMNEAWARGVDLPGLEDNISPNNNIDVLLGLVINEFVLVFSRSSDSTDRPYIMVRLGLYSMDVALMTYGPAYQISINSLLVTDKLHTTPSGQYLDLIYCPMPSSVDFLTILYRKVAANCPDFWSHFHGVETSLVVDLGTLYLLLHQEAVHTIITYSHYLLNKLRKQTSPFVSTHFSKACKKIKNLLHNFSPDTPVPPGSVKFSHSGRLSDLNIRVCDSDFDIINVQVSGLEMDLLFRANERFVFRSFLSSLNVEHLLDATLYSKVCCTDEDKVYEVKYVQNASHLKQQNEISPTIDDVMMDGSFKLHLGQLHFTFLYKLFVQLQRFVLNLEAAQFVQTTASRAYNALTKATDTLKGNSKIQISINICGPVIFLPQKSSSPNVIIIDTGRLSVENFFKESPNGALENVLMKLNEITVTRGVMTLSSTLEMQETIVEPVSFNMDIKRYIHSKTSQQSLSWNVDGALDTVHVTLGQRDICTILSIYSDNIGEGKIIDLFPKSTQSTKTTGESDETVKNLEAFFCEPKQKYITGKFAVENIKILLFFDSGELLSSPIRDLNHGLCKLEIFEVSTSFTTYTDKSLDGKLAVDSISIEEIGPDVNVFDKGILQSPPDDFKNNNCNITVNKPPIIDITFHQNKSEDKSVDVIIGRLTLSLSVPFSEKLAMFILECLPRDAQDSGIINHGYVNDPIMEHTEKKRFTKSWTIALRINKPELIFIVETTSNRRRYFITKTEILCDFSRHSNRLNLVISLSSLHTLFCNVSGNVSEPYALLKQCDMELSKCFTEEKGNKITASISGIYVQLCSEIVHSINDILNDIIEHFKIPDKEVNIKEDVCKENSPKTSDSLDLWEPKKLNDFVSKSVESLEENAVTDVTNGSKTSSMHEILLVPKFEIVVILELEDIQVLLAKSTVEVTIYDWSSFLNCTCEITLQANYFNENIQLWEPVIDPVVVDVDEYRPWDLLIKIFQDKSLPMIQNSDNRTKKEINKNHKDHCLSTTDDDSGEDMVYLEPANAFQNRSNRRVKTSLSTFLDDSDSENEDGTMEKLAMAISDLFTGDWNENEDTDCDRSSDGDEDSDDNVKSKSTDNKDSDTCYNYKKATYVLIDGKETLNITITPQLLKVLNEVFTLYSNKTLSIVNNNKTINLINDIGPQTKVELYENRNINNVKNSKLLYSRTYENQDSCPNSPSKNIYNLSEFCDENNEDGANDEMLKSDPESSYDTETLNSLEFPSMSTAKHYESINKHHLKIYVPNFQPLQTTCSSKAWEKLMRLHSVSNNKIYYLIAKHTIGRHGRNVIISSPLQIRNETCFALSILYQPSVLQQLNLEPVGDVTNPFETTMRITVLEPHEQYNVPLYIAYHCKLFIQPAYAEGHYTSDCGIWWRNLATELDSAHNFHCKPKSDSSLEVFSLRIVLKKNINITNSHAHTIPNYIIHLLPPLVLNNYLPYSLEVQNVDLKQQIKVEPGEKNSVYSLDLLKDQKLLIRIKYNGLMWSGNLHLTTHMDEKVIALSSDFKENSTQLAINVKCEREGSCNIYFYSTYWLVNKTGLPLQLKVTANNTVLETHNEDIVLFTFKRHCKQMLNMRVYESEWSNDFGLDCAGTTGLIVCKDSERRKRYTILLSISLSQMCPKFTKIITFLPNFLIANNTNRFLRFMELNEKTDLWIDLAPKQCIPFWPETISMQMYVKYRDSKLTSQAFFISNVHNTVLRMDKGGALCVNVGGGKTSPYMITFNEFKDGCAPVLVRNYCADLFLKIQQQGQGQVTLLSPYNSLLYTWDDPTKPRQLVWNIYNNKGAGFVLNVLDDGHGEEKINFHSVTPGTSVNNTSSSEDSDSSDSVKTALNKKVRRDKIIIYWLCFRDGLQKTLIFTQEQRIANYVLKKYFQEQSDFEFLFSLSGIGVSIFTPKNMKKEHVYVSLSDTPAIWEVNIGQKWKTLTLELASWIEDKYRLHCKKCQLKDYIHIDFEKMFMLKPFFAELRRTYNPAVYLQFRQSKTYQYLDFRVQSLQIDNKQSNSNDTINLHPLPTENIRTQSPFINFACFRNTLKECHIYKYINLKIQDFYLCIETELVIYICKLLTESRKFINENLLLYRNDMTFIHAPICTIAKKNSSNTVIIENLFFSQVCVRLNISNKSQINCNGFRSIFLNFLNYLFPMNISPFMPGEGIKHRIASSEQINICENLLEVLDELLKHITTQFLQQYYSQILGLQVLVNPYAIQTVAEKDETANESGKIAGILLFGCRCLLGHLNMSPAALEQCIIDIFTNQNIENIQRIRRHGSYHKSSAIPKAVTASCKNFSVGVPTVLNQIIARNPNGGIQCDGEIFFRSTGKALLSLLTRHPDDKSDNVQVAIEALRRAYILGEPIKIHQKLTRYSNSYLGLKPYSVYDSIGNHLLETVGSGRFINDTYWAHATTDKSGKSIIIVSLQHVISINKCRLWGPWELEWVIDLDDIISTPKIVNDELTFNIRQGENCYANYAGKLTVTGEKQMLIWLQDKIEQAIVVSMEEKSWTLNENQ